MVSIESSSIRVIDDMKYEHLLIEKYPAPVVVEPQAEADFNPDDFRW
jgi:hypothetical protein